MRIRVGVLIAVTALAVPLLAGTASASTVTAPTPLALTATGCVEHFDGLASSGFSATLPPGATFDEAGTSSRNDGQYSADDGSSNAGDVKSLGSTGSTDRAFGSLLSGSLSPTLGMLVRNDTGATLTTLGVSYALEQWRQGGTNRVDRLAFSYSTTDGSVIGGTYTDLAALDGVAPNGGGATGPLDGNLAPNRVAVAGAITGLDVAPGATVLLRWADVNAAGSDDALGIDDLALTPNAAPGATASCPGGGGGGGPTITKIHDVQGGGAVSPLVGQSVTIDGVVVGVDDLVGSSFGSGNSINLYPSDRGFFVEEEAADQDADPSTSEGVFVGLTSSAAALPHIGDDVQVTGAVKDGQFPPAFGQTRLETGSFTVESSANPLPPPLTIDIDAANSQAVSSDSNPTRAYYETLEGMLVSLPTGVARSGGTNKFGELFVVPGTTGGTLLRTDPVQPGLIGTADDAGAGNPANPYDPPARSTTYVQADKGDTVTDLAGPLAYSFGNFKVMVQPGALPMVLKTGAAYPFQLAPAPAGDKRIASFNLENFFPTGGALDGHIVTQAEFELKRDRATDAIGRLLSAPDVVAVMEVGDNQHLGQTGPTTSLDTLQSVATRLGELGYGSYTAYALEGNDNRGIDVGYLVKSTVTVLAGPDQRGGLTAAGSCSDVAGRLFDRPPLFLRVDLGSTIGSPWLVANHLASKSAPDSCRAAQAGWVRDQVKVLEGQGDQVIVMGDLNAFETESALTTLQDGQTTLTNLWSTVPHDSAYSFQFGGVLQTLDHVLVTTGIRAHVDGFDYAHLDNDYFQRLDQPDGHQVSDHDPPLLTLGAGLPADVPEAPQPWMLSIAAAGLFGLGAMVLRRRRLPIAN